MKVTVVTSNRGHEMLVTPGAIVAKTLHGIAESFLRDGPPSPARTDLRRLFGKWNLRSYCFDFTGPHRCRMTFSTRLKPELVFYKGGPIAIAPPHAVRFELYIDELMVTSQLLLNVSDNHLSYTGNP